MFPQTDLAHEIMDERLGRAARERLAASARQRRTSRRGILRRLAAGLRFAFSAERSSRTTTGVPGRLV
jgi:hypothetical protein